MTGGGKASTRFPFVEKAGQDGTRALVSPEPDLRLAAAKPRGRSPLAPPCPRLHVIGGCVCQAPYPRPLRELLRRGA